MDCASQRLKLLRQVELLKILLATENEGKKREFRQVLGDRLPGTDVQTVSDLPEAVKSAYVADETGKTYAENALIKARALAAALTSSDLSKDHSGKNTGGSATGRLILAEDSGFEVDYLNGAPGLYSARFARDDRARCEKILKALEDRPQRDRGARFIACVVLLEQGTNPIFFMGRKRGRVSESLLGTSGFGYDPIFIPEGKDRAWAEMDATEKSSDSHRGNALDLAIQYMIARSSQK
jgi:XTP/dITP diphosphohydrolase